MKTPEAGTPAADAPVTETPVAREALRTMLEDLHLGNVYLQALAIIVVALVASWVVDRVLTRIVASWARRSETDLDDRLIAILHRPVRLSVLFAGLAVATQLIELQPPFEKLVLGIIMTLTVLVWTVFAMRLISLVLGAFKEREDRFPVLDRRTFPLFDNVAKIIVVAAAIYFIFLSWNIDVTAWMASAGIIGLAVGFAAKDTLANLFAGIFIVADAPYKVGDYVVLDSGERGSVTHVGIRTTRLLTRDDIEITLPNSVIGNAQIINESGGRWPKSRLRVKVGVAYGCDIDQVERALMEVAEAEELACSDPEPRVRFRGFGDSSLDFELLVWIEDPEFRGKALHLLYSAVYKNFTEEGIEIPFPQRDLHLRSVAEGTLSQGKASASPSE
ncbi:MAG: mechanosensitive ion channel family protein [Acidobacteriota bacterium]